MNFAIVGAGVAGLSAAIALRKAGHCATVYEQASAVRSLGAGIVCWPNASFVLGALGVGAHLQRYGTPVHAMQRMSSDGDLLGSIDVRTIDRQMGYPSVAVLRHHLMHALLTRALALGVELHIGYRLQQLVPIHDAGPRATQLTFGNGVTVQPDWVLGAEGRMRSQCRAFVLGAAEAARPVYQGFVNWIGICHSSTPVFEPGTVQDYWGCAERFGVVALSPQLAYWAGGAAMPLGVARPARYRADLQARFAHWSAAVHHAIAHTPDSGIHQIFLHDHDPTAQWQRANVLLLGDAAHAPLPTSGQGACQALEDAWHLAQCLVAHADNVPLAWQQFVALRQPKTTGVIQAGRHLARTIFHTPPDGIAQRNGTARATDYTVMAASIAQTWSQGLPQHGLDKRQVRQAMHIPNA